MLFSIVTNVFYLVTSVLKSAISFLEDLASFFSQPNSFDEEKKKSKAKGQDDKVLEKIDKLLEVPENDRSSKDQETLKNVASLVGIDDPMFLPSVLGDFFSNIRANSNVSTYYKDAFFNAVAKRFAKTNEIDTQNIRFLAPITVNTITNEQFAKKSNNNKVENHETELKYEAGLLPDINSFSQNCIIIPVNINNGHWNIAIIDKESKKIFYFEPLGDQKHMSSSSAQQLLINNFKKQNFEFECVSNSNKFQYDGTNCGPFCLQLGLGFMSNATTNLHSLQNSGMNANNISNFLSTNIGPKNVSKLTSANDNIKYNYSNIVGNDIRQFHTSLAKGVAEDLLKVLNLDDQQSRTV